MSESWQATFSIPQETHRGSFNVKGGDDPLWNLSFEFREVNKDGPVCVIVPGHRSRGIDSAGNKKVADNVAEKAGMSVMAFDYTGDQRTVKNVDPVTMDTNIADTKSVLNAFGQRPNILLARSFGFGVSLAAANEQTQGIIGALPVPDLFEAMYKPHFDKKPFFFRWGFEAIVRTRGYFCWQPKKKDYTKVDFVKITHPFVSSLKKHKLSDIFERQLLRPPVKMIVNDNDKVASQERTEKLHQDLLSAGFMSELKVVAGDNHELSPESHDAVVEAVQSFMP